MYSASTVDAQILTLSLRPNLNREASQFAVEKKAAAQKASSFGLLALQEKLSFRHWSLMDATPTDIKLLVADVVAYQWNVAAGMIAKVWRTYVLQMKAIQVESQIRQRHTCPYNCLCTCPFTFLHASQCACLCTCLCAYMSICCHMHVSAYMSVHKYCSLYTCPSRWQTCTLCLNMCDRPCLQMRERTRRHAPEGGGKMQLEKRPLTANASASELRYTYVQKYGHANTLVHEHMPYG